MSRNLPHLLSLMVNTPLLAHPRKAAIVFNVLRGQGGLELPDMDAGVVDLLEARSAVQRLQPLASRFEGEMVKAEDGGQFPRIEPYMRTRGGTAVITVAGSMVNRGAYVGSNSGTYSYEGIGFQLKRAAKDPKTRSIVLDLESPGGEAVGAFELAALVRKINAEKPVYSMVNGMAASAGYALASGSRRIFTTISGVSGSIGVVLLHLDQSEMLKQKGVNPTLIFAGDHKVDGHPFAPLPDTVKADLQKEVTSFYQLFLDTVAEGRGPRMSRKAAQDTQGRTFIGQEAVDAKLADGVGTFEELLADLDTRNVTSRSVLKPANRSKAHMPLPLDDDNEGQNNAGASAEQIAAARAEGVREGTQAGATQERTRISAIVGDQRVKGHESYALKMALKFPTASADDIAEMVADLPQGGGAAASTQIPNLRERTDETGVNDLRTDPEKDKGSTEAEAIRTGWKSAVDDVNKSTKAGRQRTAAR